MAHPLPFILSIPHGGQTVPPEVAGRCALSEEEVFNESDSFTPQIYGMGEAVLAEISQDVARAVVDLNRPPEELPPLLVDGAVKSLSSQAVPTWRGGLVPDGDLMRDLLDRYHRPYHRRLEALLAAHRRELRMLIDCHTMSPVGPPIAKDAEQRRPLVCLSNLGDDIGVPAADGLRTSLPSHILLKMGHIMAEVFAEDAALLSHARPVSINSPFKGGYITQYYSSLGYRVLQVELSKALYLHPRWFDPESRTVEEARLRDLNGKLRAAFAELAAFIDKA